uniref:DUF2345 domain-containing protein n=1 Tax=Paraburkholderia acidipaludis TaxID=660537 RepID=UPI000486AC3F
MGAELRTAAHLVSRGGAGVMVTAYNQAGGSGKVLAMDETLAQFADHQTFAGTLAQSAEASKAVPADTQAQQSINDGLKALKKPGVLVTGPGPVAVASGDGVQLAADGPILGTAKKGIHFSTLRRFTVAAGDLLSLFTQKGMSLIAAAGDFVAQAQRGRMQLAAQEDMSVESVNGVVHVKAAKEIILNVDGTYVKLSGAGVEIGSRGGVLYRTAGVKGTGPAQMNLGGAAFAPKFVPYTTGCEVWRTHPGFVPPPAPAPEMDAAQSTGGVPPAPSSDMGAAPPPAPPSDMGAAIPAGQQQTNPGNSPLVLNDPANAPRGNVPENPDPIKLNKAVPCDWKMPALCSQRNPSMETEAYPGIYQDGSPWLDKGQHRLTAGGNRTSPFELAFDPQSKTVTATVRVKLMPKDIRVAGPGGEAVQPVQSVPYNYQAHWYAIQNNLPIPGCVVESRSEPGADFKLSEVRARIEAVLNQKAFWLVLDQCQKGASCGCRVKVKYAVELYLPDANGKVPANKTIHHEINLFPMAIRNDAASWGEDSPNSTSLKFHDNAIPHECGHLFNFPDEYYDQGGWLHTMYIENGVVNRDKVKANQGTEVWQGYSQDNVMGGGCAHFSLPGQAPTAKIDYYYGNYIAREFNDMTGRIWRVGYEK